LGSNLAEPGIAAFKPVQHRVRRAGFEIGVSGRLGPQQLASLTLAGAGRTNEPLAIGRLSVSPTQTHFTAWGKVAHSLAQKRYMLNTAEGRFTAFHYQIEKRVGKG
jgi:hypothetical protein